MPYLDHVASRGTGVGDSPSGGATSLVATFSADIAIDAVVVVRASSENMTTGEGETNRHVSLVDTAGNVWTKVGESSEEQQGTPPTENRGVTVSLWVSRITAPITSGDTATITFADTDAGRMLLLDEYSLPDPAYLLEVAGAQAANGRTTFPSLPDIAVTLILAEDEEITWLGVGAYQGGGTSVTLDVSFTTDRAAQSANGGNNSNNTTIWGQYRHVFTNTETWDASINSTEPWAMVLGGLRLVEPPPGPAEAGTREYQEDFETEGHQVERVTTSIRPDAVAWDRRMSETTGPEAIDQSTFDPETHRWRVRCDGVDVYIQRSSSPFTEWEPETLLTSVSGSEPITECDVAFTEENTIVIVAERPTGPGPEMWIYWYDPRISAETYRWENKGSGRTPRCCLDYFPTTVGPHVCPPEIDVQVVYMKPGTGMVRLEQSTYYSTEYPTVLSDSSFRYLHQFYRTEDRRLSVLYYQRDLSTGRYLPGRVDSVPYNDSLLRRPNLINWSDPGFDVMRGLGEAWNSVGVQTDDYFLRVQTQDDCDAIEVAASVGYPSGALHPFDQQVQEEAPGGGWTAGSTHDFAFSITYGNGAVSLVAFRARTRRTIGEITCYSPWRYTIIPASTWVSSSDIDINVNCDRDLLLSTDERMEGLLVQGYMEALRETEVSAGPDPRPFVCPDPPISTAPPGYWFVGGTQNHEPSFPFPTHFVRYSWRVRGRHPFNFTDEDGHWAGEVVGAVIAGGSGSLVTTTYDWPDTRFPTQFPDDTGAIPPPSVSGDIVKVN